MNLTDLDLSLLDAHPDNANAMPGSAFAKLRGHIERTGRYPPLIVRPHVVDGVMRYQLLDGHHRAAALRELGHATARCTVWDVDDDEARLLLATLNRLEGRDDPRRRAVLVAKLRESLDLKTLAARLPEDAARLSRLLEMSAAPRIAAPPGALSDMPVAVHFFLLPAQRKTLEAALHKIGGTREEALMSLLPRK